MITENYVPLHKRQIFFSVVATLEGRSLLFELDCIFSDLQAACQAWRWQILGSEGYIVADVMFIYVTLFL